MPTSERETIQPSRMRAVVCSRYGPPDVLRVEEIGVPVAGDGQVLVRVGAAAVNPGDIFSMTGSPLPARLAGGLRAPKRPVPGRAFAGIVVAPGPGATHFQAGDEVYVETSGGGYGEYAAVPEKDLARKPVNLTFDEAAAVPLAGVAALQALRDKGRVNTGDRVLINGASGGVGVLAVQIARAFGADVTAVVSPKNVELMERLGAAHVVDYSREDFTATDNHYDVIVDLAGNHSLSRLRRALEPRGTLVLGAGPPAPAIRRSFAALALSPFLRQRLVPLIQMPKREDLDELTRMIEAGAVKPVLDRVYPLEQATEAFRRQRTGHTSGRIVISVAGDATAPNPEAGSVESALQD